ncbi:MAG TPA: DoxX family protein [Polyangiaceae bacterium]|jgi:putative oxidoreductase
MAKGIAARTAPVLAWLRENLWLPALLSRLAMAGEFIPSGWSNLHNLPKMTAYFASLHIPAPGLNAVASGATELVAGVLLLVGLGTRFAAAALIVVMSVAILTAKIHEPGVHGIDTFLYLAEPGYVVILTWLVFYGGGRASVDARFKSSASAK